MVLFNLCDYEKYKFIIIIKKYSIYIHKRQFSYSFIIPYKIMVILNQTLWNNYSHKKHI